MSKTNEFEIPDEAIDYIIRNYLLKVQVAGVPVSLGIAQRDVEAVLQLLFDWCSLKGYLKDGLLTLGKFKEL